LRAGRRKNRKTKVTPSETNRQRKPRPRRAPSKDAFRVKAYQRAIARGCDRAFPHPELLRIRTQPAPEGATKAELKAWRQRRNAEVKNWKAENAAALKGWQSAHHWHPSQLRHTLGTEVRKNFGLDGSRVVLGHAEASTTEIYAQRDIDAAIKIMSQVG
jgi:hypothetical protein